MAVSGFTVLFDLDDTLFDHSGATRDALGHVRTLVPAFDVWTLDEFDARHRDILELLHVEVLAGQRTVDDARLERFRRLLEAAGGPHADATIVDGLAWGYREAYEQHWRMVPGAVALARAVKAAGASLAIVTNNGVKEQQLKVERGGLLPYVDALITSEEFGATKPDPRIILHAIARVAGTREHAVMVGDSLISDIEGARRAGVRAVWLNRFGASCPDPALVQLAALDGADVLDVILGRVSEARS
jgi:putative hydrolase of the HAD superfamily